MDIIEQIISNLYEFKNEEDSKMKEKLLYIIQSDVKYLGKISGLQNNIDNEHTEKVKLVIANLLNENKELKRQMINESGNSYLIIENLLKNIQKDLRIFNSFYVRHANIRKNLIVEIELIPNIDEENVNSTDNPLKVYKEDEDFTHILASDENIELILNSIKNLYNYGSIKEISLNYVDNIKILKNIKLEIPLKNICDFYESEEK